MSHRRRPGVGGLYCPEYNAITTTTDGRCSLCNAEVDR